MTCRNVSLERVAGCEVCKLNGNDRCKGRRANTIGCHKFVIDREKLAKVNAMRIQRIMVKFGGLKRIHPSQIKLGLTKHIADFIALPKDVRKRNSRNEKCIQIDDVSFEKWCEQCGEKFETVNESRLLCDACWDEICNRLGVVYDHGCQANKTVKTERR